MPNKPSIVNNIISSKNDIYNQLTSDEIIFKIRSKLSPIIDYKNCDNDNSKKEFIKNNIIFFLDNFYEALSLKVQDTTKELEKLEKLKENFESVFKELNKVGITHGFFYSKKEGNIFDGYPNSYYRKISNKVGDEISEKHGIYQNVKNHNLDYWNELNKLSDEDLKEKIIEENEKRDKQERKSESELNKEFDNIKRDLPDLIKSQPEYFRMLSPECHSYLRYIHDSLESQISYFKTISEEKSRKGAPNLKEVNDFALFNGNNYKMALAYNLIWLYIRLTGSDIASICPYMSARTYRIHDISKTDHSNRNKIQSFMVLVWKSFFKIASLKEPSDNQILKSIYEAFKSNELDMYNIQTASFPSLIDLVKNNTRKND